MCENQKYTKLLQMLISNLQDLQQNQSLETTPIGNAVLRFPHDNIDGSHGCDGCRKLVWPNVGHKLQSILWLIGQVCWLTTGCQVYQFWPNTNILRQIVNILPIILQLIQALLFWFDDRPNKGLTLCAVALSFFIHQFAIPVHAFLSMTFHIVWPRYSVCVRFLPSW